MVGPLRLTRPSDMWFKPALSVVVASAVPNLALFAFGRLDLVMYTMAGSLCALYGHGLPYARRVRTVAGVVVGMLVGMAISLVTASLTGSTAALIAVGALLAAGQKVLCDATRIGPPGPVIFTFVTSAALFAPQHLGQVPGHLALTAAAGAVSWLVTVGPALLRRRVRAARDRPSPGRCRRVRGRPRAPHPARRGRRRPHGLADTARRRATHPRTPGAGAARCPRRSRARPGALGAHPGAHARRVGDGVGGGHARTADRDSELAPTAVGTRTGDHDLEACVAGPDRLRAWARQTRARGPVPTPPPAPGTAEELFGIDAERAARRTAGRSDARRAVLRALGPGSPLLPIAARALIGCALAGYVSMAVGVGRPYWAIVTAASLYQANVTLSWNRALQRTLGNLLGVLVFAAVLPVSRTSSLALIACCLFFNFAAEALITRNYWLGSIAVTPMALLVLEFGGTHPAGELIGDRVLDTVIGAAVGILAAMAVTNRRATGRLERALAATDRARAHAVQTIAAPAPAPAALDAARRRLTGSLVELREAGDTAAGEWWQRALPEEHILAAEQAGHRTLAATATRQGLIAPALENGAV